MTALETRAASGLTSDPDSNILIDALMAAGLVRHIDAWTDEEAERCRLVAFDLAQREAPLHQGGKLWPFSKFSIVRNWARLWTDEIESTERFFSPYDPADFALDAPGLTPLQREEREAAP